MLKEVSREIWERTIKNEQTSVFDQPNYLELVSKLHHTKLVYYIYYRNEKALLGFSVHVRGKSVIVPDHYSYSSFWWNDTLNDFGFFDALDSALKDLRGFYQSFSFRLPPKVTDIRAFNLNGCSVKVAYTYINEFMQDNIVRKNIQEKLKQAKNYNFQLIIGHNIQEILNQQIKDFYTFGYTKSKIAFYQSYFFELIKSGFIKSYSLNLEGKLKASSLILVDQKSSKAYNLMHSTSKNNDNSQSSAYLYQQIIQDLRDDKIRSFDLYGADMKGIANFKSGFRGVLKPHYTVYYSAKRVYLMDSFGQLKSFVKKFL